MFADFYTHQLHTIVMVVSASIFFIVSICGSYAFIFKTPGAIKSYRFRFLYINSAYQLNIFFLGFFGRLELKFRKLLNCADCVCAELSGLVQLVDRRMAYVELFAIIYGLVSIVNAVFLTTLHRCFLICHPQSLYTSSPRWQIITGTAVSLCSGTVIVAIEIMSFIPYDEVIRVPLDQFIWFQGSQTTRGDALVICFQHKQFFVVFMVTLVIYFLVLMLLCYIFILRIVWKMRANLAIASKKTIEMQRALTITLLVSVTLPVAVGGVPLLLCVFAFLNRVEHIEIFFRLLFLASTWLGLLNIVATILLVEPYRNALLPCLGGKKKVRTVPKIIQKMNVIREKDK
uniref:G_PROTEIN_RECEP_F1_2 domain-containing protein n=1 Tax=Steinernema glaseri TaxID=37863 RepID=A0A1I7Y973_9BILA